jgi:hypothetical protein
MKPIPETSKWNIWNNGTDLEQISDEIGTDFITLQL